MNDSRHETSTHHDKCTKSGMLLYKYGNAIRYSVRTGCRMMTLLISLNSFQSSSLQGNKKKCLLEIYFSPALTSKNQCSPSSLDAYFSRLFDCKANSDVKTTWSTLFRLTSCATYPILWSLISGSNFGPPGMAIFNALAVKKLFGSNR